MKTETETVMMTVADEAAAEATNEVMSVCLNETEEETLEKHLDHLVSTNNDAAEAIRELLEILFHDAVSASVQPLAGDERLKLKDDVAEAETAEEHLDLKEASDSDDQPLEKDVISVIEAEAQPEATKDSLNVYLEETQTPENQLLTEQDVKKSDPPEEEETKKRKTRRGTRGKGRKIHYNKDKDPNDKLNEQRTQQVFLPRGSSGQTNNIKSCDDESREVVRPRRVQEEWDSRSNAVPYTLTVWRTGWREEQTTEGPHRWQHDLKNCDEERRQVFHARRVQEEMDTGYYAVPFTLIVWGKGWWQEHQSTLKPERDREPERDQEPE
ncbi:uncharacterized protein LOC118800411 [Colossoma macropomum]|uniref:uncharacterized protein LOC118800411 n=1 Tax=Colossoma macropomum TaxID=42526 RepID=UPI00186512BB|nr:uncharacterized protein LOC118800411 [Colossoma macropomum]